MDSIRPPVRVRAIGVILLLLAGALTLPAGALSRTFNLSLVQDSLEWNQVRLTAFTDCQDCAFLWDLGDGTILRTDVSSINHTYQPAAPWALYRVELQACLPGESVCETRYLSVLVVNWIVVGILIAVPLGLTIVLGRRRIRVRILEAVK